ncbi:putative adenylate cyclase [Cardiosporidium cionae]|uniref:Adenylate cyclase n=1 Tax=Cardiosporidium cionae TaxID=476202 RepID=A0ABQ7JB02_9APIC|nr:putative adenylate cyclase [Cardiosporidium cionae]|eukprot:KAF8821133.1 putative adenylate cyclase [Cardiosporidium cionae]
MHTIKEKTLENRAAKRLSKTEVSAASRNRESTRQHKWFSQNSSALSDLISWRGLSSWLKIMDEHSSQNSFAFYKEAATDEFSILEKESEDETQEWRWLSLRYERRINELTQNAQMRKKKIDEINPNLDLSQFTCYVPRTILEAIEDGRIHSTENFDVIIEEFTAAVAFCDASGFTALTEALGKETNGAELLGVCVNSFFDPLIRILRRWGGDIIKFSGDAVTVVWPVDDEGISSRTRQNEVLNDQFKAADGERYKGGDYITDSSKACRLAVHSSIDLHRALHKFPTPIEEKFLTLHIGIGYGKITILQVGGIMDRWEYVVAGKPLEDIAIAEPLAGIGETVISSMVFDEIEKLIDVQEISPNEFSNQNINPRGKKFYKVISIKGIALSYPPKLAPISISTEQLHLLKRYVSPAVFKRLVAGYHTLSNELRREGSVNKFLVDDKGVLLLVMFGIPPVYHLDDPLRGKKIDKSVPTQKFGIAIFTVLTSLRIMEEMKRIDVNAGVGLSTGRVWCGTVGNMFRKEYTALGDYVNLAARLMASAQKHQILVDNITYEESKHAVDFVELSPIKVKGKEQLVKIFQPIGMSKNSALSSFAMNEMPLTYWPGWKYGQQLNQILSHSINYSQLRKFSHRPPLDYDIPCGPLFPHEWYEATTKKYCFGQSVEPLLPQIYSIEESGGVVVIKGKENLGASELGALLMEIGKMKLHRRNIPDKTHVNIANIPLLAWRKLCTEMIEGVSAIAKKEDTKVYQFCQLHVWSARIDELGNVVRGLDIPGKMGWRSSSCSPMLALNNEKDSQNIKAHDRFSFKEFINPFQLFGVNKSNRNSYLDEDSFSEGESAVTSHFSQETIAPLIGSLIHGFTSFENSIVALHVRSGTSVFAEMDNESWKVASVVARVAMLRRKQKIEATIANLKEWRRLHSRKCLWCKGYKDTIQDINGNHIRPVKLTVLHLENL